MDVIARSTPRIRVAIDVTSWINCRGFGRFTRELVRALVRRDDPIDYVFIADSETARSADLPEGPRRVVVRTSAAPARAASATGNRSLPDLVRMAAALARTPADLAFFPTDYTYFPVVRRLPVIVGVHDATTWTHPELIFPSARSRFLWRLKERLALAQASAVVTVSESAREQIERHLRVPRERITVLPEAASPVFSRRALDDAARERLRTLGASPDDRYVLHVGGVSPHKNLARLVRVFARIAKDPRHTRLRLVLAGDTGGQDVFHSSLGDVRELLARESLNERVVLTGYVPDDQLALLYNGAAVLAFPSLSEGFGLPAVEAMACGTPVAASNTTSLPEVLGDAAVTFDPSNEAEMERALRLVLEDDGTRARLRDAGLARARAFSWDRAAEILAALLHETVNRGGSRG